MNNTSQDEIQNNKSSRTLSRAAGSKRGYLSQLHFARQPCPILYRNERDAFLGKFWQNRMLASPPHRGLAPPPREILDLPLMSIMPTLCISKKNKLGSQQCLNKQPGYICDCDRGYEIVAPGYQCRGKLWLYLASEIAAKIKPLSSYTFGSLSKNLANKKPFQKDA